MSTTGDRALREGAAWLDISDRGRLRASGEDRVRLLHALATNPVEGLGDGGGTGAFFLNPQGRIQAFARIYVGAGEVLLDTDARRRERLAAYLDSFIIMDDVTLGDVTAATAAIAVEGPRSADIVERALDGLRFPERPHAHAAAVPWRVFSSALSGQSGGWILADSNRKSELIERLEAAGAVAAAPPDFQRLRVVSRVPSLDDDYFDTNIPHETQQLRWVSFTKGCYTGQEIVERVRSQGRVNRLLTPLEIDGSEALGSLQALLLGEPVGEVTSPVLALEEDRLLGFAILRRQAMEAPAGLSVDGREARVLPWPV